MRYALRRAGQAAIVLIAAFTATFFLLQLLPGDAILIKFDNPELGLTPEQIEAIRVVVRRGRALVAAVPHHARRVRAR